MNLKIVRRSNPRVLLREHTRTDLDTLTRIWCDPTVTRHLATETLSPSEAGEKLDDILADVSRRPRIRHQLAVVRRSDDAVIGTCGLDAEDTAGYVHSCALIPDTRHQGLAVDALELLVGIAFDELGLHRVWCGTNGDNTAPQRVLLGAGFRRTGRVEDHYFKQGRWWDVEEFTLTAHEWRTRTDARPA
ncbi:GNAT family N-acetyltransferase [Streptoverticillium reticulum]|uniref:GNAT family N-acetyltransferase n=1 Tax=Streptomyces TaxID=1883 RepID=UPI0036A895C2